MTQLIDKPKFARRLRAAIVAAGFKTQKDFAEAIGITSSTVSQYVCGESVPRLGTLVRICRVLNVQPYDLIRDEQTTE